jgi:chloramphenicol-sensitive protein RarD
MSDRRRGISMGVAAYLLWGFLPLYWPLLRPTGAPEILAHRIAWSLVLAVALLAQRRELAQATRIGSRRLGLLALAAMLVATNWGLYIWAVNAHHVVETSLGYFINPIVTVLLGVLVLAERLRRAQWVAVLVATIAVVVLAVDYGQPPFIALALAVSFAFYALVKKRAAVPSVQALAIETAVLAPPAIAYLILLEARGLGAFGHRATALLVSTGPVTAIPLLLFAGAANRVPLTTIGSLQYIAPLLQFTLGVFVFHEPMPGSRWFGFVLVWLALGILVWDGAMRRGARES